jgi:hypothetical protein
MTFEELNATLDNKSLKSCNRCEKGEFYQIHAPMFTCWKTDQAPRCGYYASKVNHVMESGLCTECETEVNKRKYDELN